MVNPGAFSGTREDFITAQKTLYAEAVTENHVADTVADVQRRYFKRYPISLPHTVEPDAEWLARVDDNGPDADLLPPDEATLDKDAFKAAQDAYNSQVKLLKFRKDISRRLNYQYTKDQSPTKHIAIGSEDPMAILMAKLAGIPMKKPRIRTSYNVWSQENRQLVDAVYEERVQLGNVPSKMRAALRVQVCKEYFAGLDQDVRRTYEKKAVEEHRVAVEKIEEALNAPPSQDPADRQQVLKELPNFIQPILDIIANYTGWKATLLLGGPEPADQGRLNMMSFHSGESIGNIKMNFGRSERRAYKNFVMPIFGNFLKKCYTVEDCRAAALSDPTVTSLTEFLQMDNNDFTVDAVDAAISYVKVARTPSANHDFNAPEMPPSPSPYNILVNAVPPLQFQKSAAKILPLNPLPTPPSPSHFIPQISPQTVLSMQTSVPYSPALSPCASVVPSPAASPCASPLPTPHTSPVFTLRPLPSLESQEPAVPIALPAMLSPRVASPVVAPRVLFSTCPQALLASTPRAVPSTPLQASFSPRRRTLSKSPSRSLPAPTSSVSASPLVLQPVIQTSQKRSHLSGEDVGSANLDDPNPPRKRLRSFKDKNINGMPDQSPADTAAACTGSSSNLGYSVPPPEITSPLTPAELAACPDWFLKAYQMLLSQDLGLSWIELVRAWARFEKESCYQEQAKLGTDTRPQCVAAWIARARSVTYRPTLGALALFEKGFATWWASLQPAWRQGGPNGSLSRESSDLEDLNRPGKNGLLSVLAALFFWAVYAEKVGHVGWEQPWRRAMDDVSWVIQNLRTV